MKVFLKAFALSILVTGVGILTANAQDTTQTEICPDLEACVKMFSAELKKPECDRGKAVEVGEFIAVKFANDELNKELVAKVAARAAKEKEVVRICKREAKYNSTYKAKQWEDYFAVSKEIMNDPKTRENKPLLLDLTLTHTSALYDLVVAGNDKFTSETISFSKTALQMIDSGIGSSTQKFGVFAPFNSRDNAISWLNYFVGYTYVVKLKDKDTGIPFIYKATRLGDKKTDSAAFAEIGYWYTGKATDLLAEYKKLVDATEDKVATDEAKEKLGLARAYADRAIDAFGRAKTLATDATKTTEYGDTLTELYKIRFNGKVEGLDKYVSDMIANPMPDPASAPAPVVLEGTTSTTDTKQTTNTSTEPVKTGAAATAAKTSVTTVKKTTPRRSGNK